MGKEQGITDQKIADIGAAIRAESIEFANFVGNRPMPEYSQSTNKWRWWDNDTRRYKFDTTEGLYAQFKLARTRAAQK